MHSAIDFKLRYWIYAFVKLNCMIVTNDEMRDHMSKLPDGDRLFPLLKERHQNYNTTSSKLRNPDGAKRSSHTLIGKDGEMDLPYIKATQPVSNMLEKAEKDKTGSVISIPKHSKKVTHHEYEVETSHGRTITKRRKTKSTIMFQDPTKNKRLTSKVNTPRDVITKIKGGSQPNPANIGDLFSEGSLNPYADDPYAFD